jgi:signal transduction histidine kinase
VKKIALVYVLAVLIPSVVLAWLALRSVRDQELVSERQRELLYQGTTDRVAEQIREVVSELETEFGDKVEALAQDRSPRALGGNFDREIRSAWPMAEVGFCVTLDGAVLSPSLLGDREAKDFRAQNEGFLSNAIKAEVYQMSKKGAASQSDFSKNTPSESQALAQQAAATSQFQTDESAGNALKQNQVARKVSPLKEPRSNAPQFSNLIPSDAEFRQIIGEANSGSVARFFQNKLSVMFWHRAARDPQLVFGVQLALDRLKQRLAGLLQIESDLASSIGLAVLDDNGASAVRSSEFSPANWKRPFVATEVGEALPHWEVAAYLLDARQLNHSASTLRRTIISMTAVMLIAICAGGWLLVADVRRQLILARQKTDFVSNVSHELKTPLTSIRMFSELLAEGRVETPGKQKEYSQIIATEASRLTRLINNVLDFARLERGEQKYNRRRTRLDELVAETVANYRPQLEANGFRVDCTVEELTAEIDRDAIAQAVLNLLSNAEKYAGEVKEICVTLDRRGEKAAIEIRDRGLGVPGGSEEKIFAQFHRAHDALNSGISGAGLGLTLARHIARAHGGDIVFSPREGGGSCFAILLPIG